jgi:hypothetical protein
LICLSAPSKEPVLSERTRAKKVIRGKPFPFNAGLLRGPFEGKRAPKVNGDERGRIWYSEVGLISQGGIMATAVAKLAATRDPFISLFA